MKIYFFRHGESEANQLHVFSNVDDTYSLTEKGVEQVTALAARLRNSGIERLYVSPLLRAQQSATIISQALGVETILAPALVEYFVGRLEGRSDDEAWNEYWRVSKAWTQEGRFAEALAGGESVYDMYERFGRFVDRLRAEKHHETIGLMSHGGLLRCMLPLVLKNVDFSFMESNELAPASCVVAESHRASLFCTQWQGLEVRMDELLVDLSS